MYFLANSKMSSQAKTKVQPLDKATIHNLQFHCHKVKKDTFQCSNVLLIYLNVERLKFQVGNRSKFQKIKRSSSQIE